MARGERPTNPEIQISPESIENGERVHPLVADIVIKIDESLARINSVIERFAALGIEKKNWEEQVAEKELNALKTKALLTKAELHLLAGDVVGPAEINAETMATVKSFKQVTVSKNEGQCLTPAVMVENTFLPDAEELADLAKVETVRFLAMDRYLTLQEEIDRALRPVMKTSMEGTGYNKAGDRSVAVDMTGVVGKSESKVVYNPNTWNRDRYFDKSRDIMTQWILADKPVVKVLTKGELGQKGSLIMGTFTGDGFYSDQKGYAQLEIPPLDAQTTLHVAHVERIKAKFGGGFFSPTYSPENRLQIDPETGVEYVKGSNKAEETKNKIEALRDYVQVEEKFRAMVEKDLGANEPLTELELRKRHKETKKTLAGKEVALTETEGALENTRVKEAEARAEVMRLGVEVRRLSDAQKAGEVAQAASNREIVNLRTEVSALATKQSGTESTSATNLEAVKSQARLAIEAEKERSAKSLANLQAEHQKQLEQLQAILASAGTFNKGEVIKKVLAMLGQ